MGKVHAFASGVDARLRTIRKLLEQLPADMGFVLGVQKDAEPIVFFTNIDDRDLADEFDRWVLAVDVRRERELVSVRRADLVELRTRAARLRDAFGVPLELGALEKRERRAQELYRRVLELLPFEASTAGEELDA